MTKWGNSLGVRIPAAVAETIKIHDGSLVEIDLQGDKVIIWRKPYTLQELLDGITEENLHSETYWGPPVGQEEW